MIYLLTCFTPFIQIVFGYLIGAIISMIAEITSLNSGVISILFNLVLSAYFLFSYLKADSYKKQIINASIASIFISCLVLFVFEDFLINTEYYQYQFVLGAILVGICLISIDFIRSKIL